MKLLRTLSLWDAAPLGLGSCCFAGISIINWPYIRKFFEPTDDPSVPYLGLALLGIAILMLVAAGFFNYGLRRLVATRDKSIFEWIGLVLATCVVLFLTVGGVSTLILGPAAITMSQQMRQIPR